MRKRRLLAIMCAAIVCAALITAVGSGFTVKSMAASTPWTGTWSASPESGGESFGQQTLRQIVHTSIGGTSAQVQVSNVFGTTPLEIADVHVALRSSGSTVVSGSNHTVTFGGQSSITIPAGGLAVSDAVAMSVPALSDLAVSMYLPQSTGPSTYHQQGTATNYIASGDVSGNASLSGAQTTNSYFFLTNFNVQNTAAQGAVVTLGASITDGYASTTDANERWPNDLAVRLANSGRTIGVLNQGISGNRLLVDGSGQSALNRFDRDVLSQPGVKWVIFSDDPINDLGSTSPAPTSAQLIAGLQQLISMAHQNGIEFLCSTLTPYQGASYWTQQGETEREAYNAYVLSAGSGCDGVIDQAAATSNPSDPTMYLPAYDSGDHLHPNDAGYQAIANAVNLNLFGGGAEGPYGGTAAAVPGTVQAANYDTGGQGVAYNVTSVNGNGATLPVRRGRPRDHRRHAGHHPGRRPVRPGLDGDRAMVQVHGQRGHRGHLHREPAARLAQRGHRRPAHRQLRRDQPVRRGRRPGHRRLAGLDHGDDQRDVAGRPADPDHRPGQRRLEHPLPDVRRVRERGLRRDAGSGAGHGSGGQLRHGRAGRGLQRLLGQRDRRQLPV